MRIADISRYQVERPDPLDLAKAKAAGITAVNIALDRGKSTDVLSGWARTYADKARSLGLGLSAYRWLDSRQSGAEHARRALDRIRELGGPDGMAHAVDCEDNAGLQTLTDYVHAMQDGLQRPITIYTGRWWIRPRGWNIADLSPYLWAAPSTGYLDTYPGDTSPHWQVDYGGHTTLSLLQYAVAPLPGTGNCSLTAVRDPAVWSALTGATPMPTATYTAWVNAGRPNQGPIRPLKALRDLLRRYGYTVYDIGNQDHLTHNPPEDHTPFSATGWPGAAQKWWLHALDIMPPKADSGLPSLQQLGARLLADRKAGYPGAAWLKYMNWEPDRDNGGACWQERFMPDYVRRTSSDRGHIHLSARTDMVAYSGADSYDPVARIRAGASTTSSAEGDDMGTLENLDEANWRGGTAMGPPVPDQFRVDKLPELPAAAAGQRYGNSHNDRLYATQKLVEQAVKDVAELKARPAVDAAALAAALAGNTGFVTAFAAAVAAQVNQQAGATADQVRKIVDEELDEQSLGGADKD